MASNKWQKVKSDVIIEHQYYNVRHDYLVNPRNQKEVKVTVFDTDDAANIVAITKDLKMVLVHQYRFGTNSWILECPGGFIDEGENQQAAAQRELLEETGYGGGNWQYLGNIPNNPAFMSAYIHHWLATDVELLDQQDLDEAEDMEVRLVEVEEVKQMLFNGRINHPHAVSALVKWIALNNESE